MKTLLASTLILLMTETGSKADDWSLSTQQEWKAGIESLEGADILNGQVTPREKGAKLRTHLHQADQRKKARSLTIAQSTVWQNWEPIENLGPSNLSDAPVLLTIGPNNYWMFGRYGGKRKKNSEKQKEFKPATATLKGFDSPLQTTRFPNQFDAPGGLKPGKGGYHAWQSRDMKNWVHHGPVTEGFSKWVTSAEHIDGKTLIYYDFPNDQDPHVYVDEDLFDGEPGKNLGIAVKDPSH
ncbi:MAG: hypothetical protein VYC80_17545, partial [Planctomycetota bacterium]|nr:hypothetical protein [Planctomycetota bacterium]